VLEENKSVALKLQKLIVILGKSMRAEMGLPVGLRECSLELQRRMLASYERVHQ
jgi:hypothetical protein